MAKDGKTLYLEILIELFTNPEYYTRGEISDRLQEINVDPRSITSIIPKLHKHDAPTKTSTSYVLDLISEDHGRPLVSLFAQFYYTGMVQSTTPGIPLRPEKRKANLLYRKEQLDFLGRIGLPVPHAFTIMNKDSGGNFATALLTEYWRYGSPHSLNVLALNYRLAQIEQRYFADHTLAHYPYNELKKRLDSEKELINKIKNEMIDSSLDTINLLASIATHAVLESKDFKPIPKESFNKQKIVDSFSSLCSWYSLIDGGERFSVKRNREKSLARFTRAMTNLTDFVNDPTKTIYVQGDEFLYHFQYHKIDGRLFSGVFDFDRAGFDRIEKSKAKLLLSILLDYDYKQVEDLILRSNKRLEELLNYTGNNELNKRLDYVKEAEKFMLNFDIAAVYEAIRMADRIAFDNLRHKDFVVKREESLFDFNNFCLKELMGDQNYLKLPEKVPLISFSASNSIPTLKSRLEERLSRMIKGETVYGKAPNALLSDLETVLELFHNFGLKQTDFLPKV